MRPISIRCSWNFHRFDEVDEFNRCWCSRCGARQGKAYRVLSPEDLEGRQTLRPKTRGQR